MCLAFDPPLSPDWLHWDTPPLRFVSQHQIQKLHYSPIRLEAFNKTCFDAFVWPRVCVCVKKRKSVILLLLFVVASVG